MIVSGSGGISMKKFSRRDFLAQSAVGAIALTVPTLLNGSVFAAEEAKTGPKNVASAHAGEVRNRAEDVLKISDDDTIRDILKRRIDVEKHAVGMAVCVITPGRQSFVTWGRERLSDNRPVTPDTVFEIGSITKVFTALLLADMVRRSEMRLNDPVARHLPSDFHIPLLKGRQITLADLATHTSGLPRWPTSFAGPPPSPGVLDEMARFSIEKFKTWLANFRPQSPLFAGAESAKGWFYSNIGYALLGLAIAYRGGQPYESLLQVRVLDPMGLQDTTFKPTKAMLSRLAESHDAKLTPIPPFEGGIFIAAGALRSTPRDLTRFADAILAGSGSTIASDEKILLSIRQPAPWIGGFQALGWEVLNAPGGAFLSKDGVTQGQAASIVVDPDKHIAIVVLSNTAPDLSASTLSGGGIGAADIARHLLRPKIPMDGQGGARY